jgi:MinD-like ATPase involved in chromosome partitioning or flagellar assembly
LLPSVIESEKTKTHFSLNPAFGEIEDFTARLVAIIDYLRKGEEFDYILLDTRGGTDYTSVGAAFAAGYFVLVSEADRPSWHMGELLLDSIRKTKGKNDLHTEQIGFILNKVNLPAKAIENYLLDRWKAPHLGTIQYNEKLIRFFQQSKSPILEDASNSFNRDILSIVSRSLISKNWNERHLDRLSSVYSPGLMRRLADIMF